MPSDWLAGLNKQNSLSAIGIKAYKKVFSIKSGWLLLIWSTAYAVKLSHSC